MDYYEGSILLCEIWSKTLTKAPQAGQLSVALETEAKHVMIAVQGTWGRDILNNVVCICEPYHLTRSMFSSEQETS